MSEVFEIFHRSPDALTAAKEFYAGHFASNGEKVKFSDCREARQLVSTISGIARLYGRKMPDVVLPTTVKWEKIEQPAWWETTQEVAKAILDDPPLKSAGKLPEDLRERSQFLRQAWDKAKVLAKEIEDTFYSDLKGQPQKVEALQTRTARIISLLSPDDRCALAHAGLPSIGVNHPTNDQIRRWASC